MFFCAWRFLFALQFFVGWSFGFIRFWLSGQVRLFIRLGVDLGACYWVWLSLLFCARISMVWLLPDFFFGCGWGEVLNIFNAFWYWIHGDIMLWHLLLVLCLPFVLISECSIVFGAAGHWVCL